VQELAGTQLAPWKPVTGENLFTRESGAVAAQFHDPPAIEPYASELVGAERGIVLGKKSGLDSIRIKVAELGLDVPAERYSALLDAVKRAGTKKRGLVTDVEFRRMASRIKSSDD
jgi:isopropylmalate/homocitrate/citramalate synthase